MHGIRRGRGRAGRAPGGGTRDELVRHCVRSAIVLGLEDEQNTKQARAESCLPPEARPPTERPHGAASGNEYGRRLHIRGARATQGRSPRRQEALVVKLFARPSRPGSHRLTRGILSFDWLYNLVAYLIQRGVDCIHGFADTHHGGHHVHHANRRNRPQPEPGIHDRRRLHGESYIVAHPELMARSNFTTEKIQ